MLKYLEESKSKNMKVILIDGNSLMFRSYYATAYTGNLMKNSNGLYTNAIFGFCNMINKLKEEEHDYMFVAFDAGKHTFRHQAYKDYKGGRKAMPDEFRVQIPYIKKYLDLINISHLEMDEFEADDLIASVSQMAYMNDDIDEIQVVSGDKDLLQLVNDKIHVTLTKKGITDLDDYNIGNFFEKMGIYPKQVPDYKGLVGDTSDNLPGIKGIGEKTALKLLAEYETLDNLINHVSDLKGKTRDLISDGSEIGLKCKYFATLKYDINFDFDLDALKKKEMFKNDLIEFFKELEFKSFLKKLEDDKSSLEDEIIEEKIKIDVSYEIIDDVDYDFSNFGDRYIVCEVNGNNYYNSDLLGIALYSPVNDLFSQNVFVTKDVILNSLSFREYLLSDNLKKTFDYKKLLLVLRKYNLDIKNVSFDLLLGTYLINPKYANDDFYEVVCNFKNFDLLKDKELIKMMSKNLDINEYSLHAIKKAYVISCLEDDIRHKLDEFKLNDLFLMELRLSEVLASMELNGLVIDLEKLNKLGSDFEVKMNEFQEKIYDLAGMEFNINSVKQLNHVLFERLNLPVSKKNKTGFSTSVEVLESLAKDYDIAKYILEYRTYSKLLSTYVKGLIDVMDDSLYIHPLYKQALTMTGRLSSVEPNIQNMPIRTEEGQIIRDIFVSRFDGGLIMSADYSQIELRVLAHMSNDEEMIKSFNSGDDFHSLTASYIFGVDIKDVTKNMRRCAKAINFGIVYGMSAWGLSESIGISPKDASVYIKKYFEKHQSIDLFLKNVINDAKNDGFTKTMFNRLRYIPELQSMNRNIYSFGERTAMNAPIQGSAADIMKYAMVDVYDAMKELNLKSKMIAQVHDELVFDVYPDEVDVMKKLVREKMENVFKLKVDLIVSISVGETWLKA